MIQGTDEWLAWRRQGIGGSEIAAVINICPYSTPYTVWCEKTGRTTGFKGNYATQRGSELEAKARNAYELIALEDMPPALAVHPKYDIMRVSLDGMRADRKVILEIKCPGAESHQIAMAGKLPDHYMSQVQYQLAVTGADLCHYFSYSESLPHALVEVKPDIFYQGILVAKALQFWELVKSNTPPPLTDRDVKVIDDNGGLALMCKVIELRRDNLSKAELDFMKALAIQMGGHPKIRCGNVQISTVLRNGRFSYNKLTIGAS